MAKYTWTGGGDGSSWNDPNNWDNVTTGDKPATSAPGAGDDVSIGGATINDSGAADHVDAVGLTIGSSGSLDVSTMFNEQGSLTVEGSLTTSGFKASGGTVDINSGSFTVTNVASVMGGASIRIEDGATAKISSNAPTAASLNVGGGSSITVTGSGTELTTGTGGVNLGLHGSGSLDIENGATVKSSQGDPTRFTAFALGIDSTGSGSVTVNGNGSTFIVGPGELQVGTSGRGNLTISDGGSVSVSQFGLGIADFSGSTGNVEVTGQGSTLDSASWITVGDAGTGSLAIENNGTVEADILNSGVEASSIGNELSIGSSGTLTVNNADLSYADGSGATATIDGSGSLWTINGFLTVGDGGDATLTIQGQGEVDADTVIVARQATSTAGEIDVDGQGSLLKVAGDITIAFQGVGSVSITAGGEIDASVSSVTFASQDGSTGALTITGDGSSMTAAALTFGDHGTAIGTIEDGGALSVNGDLSLGDGDGGSGNLTVAAGDLTVGGNLTIGGAGTGVLVSQGGAITVQGSAINIGDQASGTGTFTLNTADASLDFSGTVTVGASGNGAMFVQLGAAITVDAVTVADQTGSTGSLTVDSDTTVLQTSDLTIGSSGQGTLDVKNGASLISTGEGKIADLVAGVISSATVEAGGIWALNRDLTVGGSGIGTLSVNDATVSTLSSVTIGDLAVSSGFVTVTGSVTNPETGTSPSSLGWGEVLTVGNDGYGTLSVEDGGLVESIPGGTGEVDIAAHDGSTGSITVDGVNSLLGATDLVVGGTLLTQGGVGTLTAQQGGSVAVTDTVTLWDGNVDVADGGLLVIGTVPSASDPAADSTILVRSDGLLTGDGTITGDVIDDGTIDAEHGTLKIDGAVSGSGVIDIGAQAIAEIDGSVAAATRVDFLTDDGTLRLDQPSDFSGTIDGLQLGDMIDLAGVNLDPAGSADLDPSNNVLTVTENGHAYHLQFDKAESFAGKYFHLSPDGGTGTLITETTVACYCRGTLIATPSGDVPTESLKIGDKVVTASGVLRPIKWIGRRAYGGRFLLGQKHILPVCIKAGSLAENTPRRDLWISPHHAMYLEGVLIEARDLVNGINIVQPGDTADVEYFHIELDSHDVIVAEGALSETFIDDGSRGMFHNAREYYALYPEATAGSALYYAPRCDAGYAAEAARRNIEARAGLRPGSRDDGAGKLRGYVDVISPTRIEGWAQNERYPEAPVCLDILIDGECIDQVLANRYRADLSRAGLGSGNHSFCYVARSDQPIGPGFVEIRRSLDRAPLAASAQCGHVGSSGAGRVDRSSIMKRA